MSNIVVEDQKLFIEEKEEHLGMDISIERNKYVVINDVKKIVKCDAYNYDDYDLFATIQNLYNEKYLNFLLYNKNTNTGYKLLSLDNSLDVQIKRVTNDCFVVVGKNADIGSFGQVSFCNLMQSGEVNEIVYNFNKLKQVVFVTNKFVVLNYFEVIDNGVGTNKEYIYTISINKPNGTIEKILVDEKFKSYVDYTFEIKAGVVSVYKLQKGEKIKVAEYNIKNKNK